jgi:predicted phage gp36 major capsid-like protein
MQCGPTVLNTGGGETLQVPKTTAHSTAASAAQAGNAGRPRTRRSTMQPLSAWKYGVMLQVARELIDDTAVDLLGYLAMQAGRALGNAFGTALVNGSGTSEPAGVVTAATAGVTGAVTGVSGAPSATRTWWTWSTASSLPTGSHEAATGWQRTRRSAGSARSPTPWAARSGSPRPCSGQPGPAARQAAGGGPVHAGSGHLGSKSIAVRGLLASTS